MGLHDSNLSSFVIDVLIEGDETWLIGFDEVDQSRDAQSLGVKLSRLQSVRRDEDERPRHGVPPLQSVAMLPSSWQPTAADKPTRIAGTPRRRPGSARASWSAARTRHRNPCTLPRTPRAAAL